jgi:hypothetical protein
MRSLPLLFPEWAKYQVDVHGLGMALVIPGETDQLLVEPGPGILQTGTLVSWRNPPKLWIPEPTRCRSIVIEKSFCAFQQLFGRMTSQLKGARRTLKRPDEVFYHMLRRHVTPECLSVHVETIHSFSKTSPEEGCAVLLVVHVKSNCDHAGTTSLHGANDGKRTMAELAVGNVPSRAGPPHGCTHSAGEYPYQREAGHESGDGDFAFSRSQDDRSVLDEPSHEPRFVRRSEASEPCRLAGSSNLMLSGVTENVSENYAVRNSLCLIE